MSARYWIGLFVNTARFYARNRRPIAGVRALLRVLRGDNGEQCQICGRDYLRWRTSDEFYQQVHGSLLGTLCPAHFQREAEASGQRIYWTPVRDFASAAPARERENRP